MPAPQSSDVLAAGAVVFRPGRRVLVVHRPKYDDWSFPKGKVDPGEHPVSAAVREVDEETGLHVRLGVPLPGQRYPLAARMKTVDYWVGRVVGDDDVSHYLANEEIDQVVWLDLDEAVHVLSYDRDRETLRQARDVRRRTRAVVLVGPGRPQADRLVPVVAAYGVTRVIGSPGTRCGETVQPFAHTTGWERETAPDLTEQATAADVRAVLDEVLADDRPTLVCAHRPVLSELLTALGRDDPPPAPGELVVVHLRKGRVAGLERHHLP